MLTDCGFWRDFLANFLSDFLVGLIVGIPLAWWVGRRLIGSERSQQRKDEKRAELEKAIRYLGFLKDEIDNLLVLIISSTDRYRQAIPGSIVRTISTPFWDSLQPSGELPRLLRPDLLSSLALFYSWVAGVRQGNDLILDSWSAPPSLDRKAFVDLILDASEQALKMRDLPSKLDSEIQHLKAQLGTL